MRRPRRLLAAASCAAFAARLTAADAAPPRNTATGLQVGAGACVTSTDLAAAAPMAEAVLTALVSKGVNLIGAALGEAGRDKTWKSLAARNLPGGSAPFPACVQVVRGRFRTDAPAAAAAWAPSLGLPPGAYEQLKANGLWPADRPDFFFEGTFVVSADRSAAAVRPLMAAMTAPQDEGSGERGVVVLFSLSPPGTRPGLETNPAATVVLGPMAPGQTVTFPRGAGASTTPYESDWFSLSQGDAGKPLTLTAMVTETRAGSPFLAFLATIFNDEGVKNAVTGNAEATVLPAGREPAGNPATSPADAADSRLADAITALRACHAGGPDALVRGADAKASLRAYLAAEAAMLSASPKIDGSAVDLIDIAAPDEVPNQCSLIHQKLTGKRL